MVEVLEYERPVVIRAGNGWAVFDVALPFVLGLIVGGMSISVGTSRPGWGEQLQWWPMSAAFFLWGAWTTWSFVRSRVVIGAGSIDVRTGWGTEQVRWAEIESVMNASRMRWMPKSILLRTKRWVRVDLVWYRKKARDQIIELVMERLEEMKDKGTRE